VELGPFEKITFFPPDPLHVGPIQTGFLRGFRKRSGGMGIMIPVKKVPQERKTQESGGFLQELPT
jgi:hypothetical protein